MKKWIALFVIALAFSGIVQFRLNANSAITPVTVVKEKVIFQEKAELILFTDTIRCPPCRDLHKEMTPEKIKKLEDKYILKVVDFANPTKDTEAMSYKHKIWGTPTVIVNGKALIGSKAINFLREEMK